MTEYQGYINNLNMRERAYEIRDSRIQTYHDFTSLTGDNPVTLGSEEAEIIEDILAYAVDKYEWLIFTVQGYTINGTEEVLDRVYSTSIPMTTFTNQCRSATSCLSIPMCKWENEIIITNVIFYMAENGNKRPIKGKVETQSTDKGWQQVKVWIHVQ